MYHTLYIDVFFLENLLTDYLLLSLTDRLLKLRSGLPRRLAAAAAGSLAVCVLYGLGWQRSMLGKLLLHGAVGPCMALVSRKWNSRRLLLQSIFLLYLNAFLLGGIFGWLWNTWRFPAYPFLFFTLVSYGILKLSMRALFRQRRQEQSIRSVTVRYRGKSCTVRALLDTGNGLRDPVFGKPVSIITEGLKKQLLEAGEPVWYPIPYRSVGREHGFLPAFYADVLEIREPDGRKLSRERPLLGVTKEPLSSDEYYSMILHPALTEQSAAGGEESGRNEMQC